MSYINAYIWNLNYGTDEHHSRAGIEVQMLRLDMWTQQGRGGWDEPRG